MRRKNRSPAVWLAAGILIAAVPLSGGCSRRDRPAAESTAPATTAPVWVEQAGMVLRSGLSRSNYAGNEAVEAWVKRCSEDDTGTFDAFALYSVYVDGETATHRYLILRQETSPGIVASGRVLRRTDGGMADCELEITYAYTNADMADSVGSELLFVTVTLPADDQPVLTLLAGEDSLSYRLTRTDASLEPVL